MWGYNNLDFYLTLDKCTRTEGLYHHLQSSIKPYAMSEQNTDRSSLEQRTKEDEVYRQLREIFN